eukprot:2750111-Prymnesium_polylepis.1
MSNFVERGFPQHPQHRNAFDLGVLWTAPAPAKKISTQNERVASEHRPVAPTHNPASPRHQPPADTNPDRPPPRRGAAPSSSRGRP